jgi:hypothetical protein
MQRLLLAVIFFLSFSGSVGAEAPIEPLALMPRVADYTLMYWAEGFPSHTPTAPWRRIIRTGSYALALDTETLTIPHFGALPAGSDYATTARADDRAWESLPKADLSLTIIVNGKRYYKVSGGKWSQFGGPRLIDSGRFVQRADVTDLVFATEDGTILNAETRFETVAWPDRLALILAAKPGALPFPAGEACYGRVGGGYGLDGTNHLEIPHRDDLEKEKFTLELWAFVPTDHKASEKVFPWLVCKNAHEQADGNYGLVILNGRPQARMNVGGGREQGFTVDASPQHPLKIEQWNHLAMSYDGDMLKLYVNGAPTGGTKIGRPRTFGKGGIAFGRRQDNSGDGYHFRGAIDEVRLYDRALSDAEIRERFSNPQTALPGVTPVLSESFAENGMPSLSRPTETWTDGTMEIRFAHAGGEQMQSRPTNGAAGAWQEVGLALDLTSMERSAPSPVTVSASETPSGKSRPVSYEANRGWHRVDLDGLELILPPGETERKNDALERLKLVLANPTDEEQVARLLFEKTTGGIRQAIGAPITGVSAILRDASGEPTGIPVQLSKNWHNRPEGGVYSGQWFHGFSQVRLPAGATVEFELTLAYGHWGGVAAASHAQLCLIGWGSNQLWDQSALGSWGESICYEPDQVQGECSILDVRPLMVGSMNKEAKWGWTHNVGGGDFFRFFDSSGNRVPHTAMRTAYERQGPCLTEVTYAGKIGSAITHHETVSLTRSDDLVRGTYRMRLDVREAIDFSRFVLFQIGADTYSYTSEKKMALGNEAGLIKEWSTTPGGEIYRTEPVAVTGTSPWVSLHEAAPRRSPDQQGAWPNRGLVIRSWSAVLGGRAADPWLAERGVTARGSDASTIDILPPPGVTRLEVGDYVEATIEHLIVPAAAADYYGPNAALKSALATDGDTWRMIHREAVHTDRTIELSIGTLKRTHPAITIATVGDTAAGTIKGGPAYVAITFTGLSSPHGHVLILDGAPLDQSIHGNDFWQTDFDAATKSWALTYNLPPTTGEARKFDFTRDRRRAEK